MEERESTENPAAGEARLAAQKFGGIPGAALAAHVEVRRHVVDGRPLPYKYKAPTISAETRAGYSIN